MEEFFCIGFLELVGHIGIWAYILLLLYQPLMFTEVKGPYDVIRKRNATFRRLTWATAPLPLGHGYLHHLHEACI